jgi:4-diphosphocytidyl-2-C-methyl-D-erythritol kinase
MILSLSSSFHVGISVTPKDYGTVSMITKELNWDVSLISPCKINLFLRILSRRPSGYRKLIQLQLDFYSIITTKYLFIDDLASLFQAISLSDGMSFSLLPRGSTSDVLTCSDATLSVDDSNLVLKALNLMRRKTGIPSYFKVHLEKNVPMQAGLGGGSGNAATTMYAFNKLSGFPGKCCSFL